MRLCILLSGESETVLGPQARWAQQIRACRCQATHHSWPCGSQGCEALRGQVGALQKRLTCLTGIHSAIGHVPGGDFGAASPTSRVIVDIPAMQHAKLMGSQNQAQRHWAKAGGRNQSMDTISPLVAY